MKVLIGEIKAGDILLCYEDIDRSEEKTGESGYIHVAIAINSEKILEADIREIRYTTVSDLLKSFDYLAVLRQRDEWCDQNLNILRQFAEESIGKPFNLIGMRRCTERKEKSLVSSLKRLQDHFNGDGVGIDPSRKNYFCSELVTSAFIYVGIIDSSASVVYQPETLSPHDIGKDKTFGYFVGYLLKNSAYTVHENDYFQTSI